MNIVYLHKDKCPKCKEIVWTQEDDELDPPRPSYNVQCLCGHTMIKNNVTVYGGGDDFSEEELHEKIKNNNKHLTKKTIKVKKKS